MEGFFGLLAVAGGFGLAYGLTVLGLHAVVSVMPRKNIVGPGGTRSGAAH